MSKLDIGAAIQEELDKLNEDPEKRREKQEKRQRAEKEAEAEIRTMTAERIKRGIDEAMPQVLESLDAGKFDKAELDRLAGEIAAKAALEAGQAEKMPYILAKTLLLEGRKAGLTDEMKDAIHNVAEETLLPPDLIQKRAKELFGAVRTSHEALRDSFVRAYVEGLVNETGVRKEAAEKKLLDALKEVEDADIAARLEDGNGS